ncbi:hypothetical protein NQZ68_020906 [Dissostichus eleginoides]|nr:hypothetical protein NQZ68_020906 [Dissostichus eleginoides]
MEWPSTLSPPWNTDRWVRGMIEQTESSFLGIAGLCGVVEQKDEGGSSQTRTVQLRLSLDMLDSASMTSLFTISSSHSNLSNMKHYREYLVSLINSHSIDPAPLYSSNELLLACRRYKVEDLRREGEDSFTYFSRLLQKLMDEEPLGDKVPRKK